MSELPDVYDVTFPGASVLAPGIIWYRNQQTLAVYPSIMCLVDRYLWTAFSMFSPDQLLRSTYKVCCKKFPAIRLKIKRIVHMVPNDKKRTENGGCHWRVGASQDA
jgi:hypothetical protein